MVFIFITSPRVAGAVYFQKRVSLRNHRAKNLLVTAFQERDLSDAMHRICC